MLKVFVLYFIVLGSSITAWGFDEQDYDKGIEGLNECVGKANQAKCISTEGNALVDAVCQAYDGGTLDFRDYDQWIELAASLRHENGYRCMKRIIEADGKRVPERSTRYNYEHYFDEVNLYTGDSEGVFDGGVREKIYVHPDFLEAHHLTLEQFRVLLEKLLNDIENGDPLLHDIFLSAEVMAVSEPLKHKIHIVKDIPYHEESVGLYVRFLKEVAIGRKLCCWPSDKDYHKEILVHEWIHALMYVLYDNEGRPYAYHDIPRATEYYHATRATLERLEELIGPDVHKPKRLYINNLISSIISIEVNYEPIQKWDEYVVLYPQALAEGSIRSEYVNHLYQPMKEFWDKFVWPDLREYLEKNADVWKDFQCKPEDEPLYMNALYLEYYLLVHTDFYSDYANKEVLAKVIFLSLSSVLTR